MQNIDPFADWVMVDGFLVPIVTLPETYRQFARQANTKGKDIAFSRG